MNRKLHNSIAAFSATGLVLVLALMAASPVPYAQQVPASVADAAPLSQDAAPLHTGAAATGPDADGIEARARQLEEELERSTSLGDTIASAVSFAATVSTEAALNVAYEAATDQAEARREAVRERRRHARRVRAALAVPYFSFAQGLRRGSGS